MKRAIPLMAAMTVLAGCFVEPPKTVKLYRGEWDCGQMRLQIQEDLFTDAAGQVALRMIEYRVADDLYTLFLADGREIQMTNVTETGMTLLGQDDQRTSCQRIGAPPLPD